MKSIVNKINTVMRVAVHALMLVALFIPKDAEQSRKKRALYDKPGEAAMFYIERHGGLDATNIPTDHVLAEIAKMRNGQYGALEKTAVEPWTEIGPNNIGGRTRALLIDHTTSILYAASVGGGVWKSTNAGDSWFSTTDALGNIAFTCLAMSPSGTATTRIIYGGTGEGFYNADAIRGAGLFRTTNSGATWTNVATGAAMSYYINKIAIDPMDANYVYVATNSGVYRTTNGGASFSSIGSFSGRVQDLELNPVSPDTLYVAVNGYGVYRCGNAKASTPTFTTIRSKTSQARIELAMSSSNPSIVYAMFTNTSNEPAYFERTDNGGASWTTGAIPSNDDSYLTSFMNTQGWYDIMLGVDPTDPLKVYVGGVDTYKSTNGGSSWSKMSSWRAYSAPKVHADNHEMAFESSTVFYIVNDGGVYKTTNGGTSWTAKNSGYNVTQFYYGAMSNDGSVIIGGTQDNGTLIRSGSSSSWTEIYGGDGGASLVSHTSGANMFASYVYGDFRYSTNSGSAWTTISPPGAGSSASYLFIAPAEMSPSNSSTVFIGGTSLYKTTNNGSTWTSLYSLPSGKVSAIGLSVTADTIVVGTNGGAVYRSTNGGTSWSAASPSGSGYVTDAEISFTNANVAYVTRSGYAAGGHVFYTATLGASSPAWTDISSALPALPAMSVAVSRSNSAHLLVGIEGGIYKSINTGASWTLVTSGMAAAASVEDLDILYDGSVLAATHGRGMYRSGSALPVQLVQFSAKRAGGRIALEWKTASELNNLGFAVERMENGTWRVIGFVDGAGTTDAEHRYAFIDRSAPSGIVSYRLKQVDRDGKVSYSAVLEVEPSTIALVELTMQPNPVSTGSSGMILATMPGPSRVRLSITDIAGREIFSEAREVTQAGQQYFHVPGHLLRSGMYFAALSSDYGNTSTKFISMR